MVLAQHFLDARAVFICNIDEQNVLRGGQTKLRLELLSHLAQCSLKLMIRLVLHAAVLDKQTKKLLAVRLLVPAEQIALFGEMERTRRL